jgi:hypothetical protein
MPTVNEALPGVRRDNIDDALFEAFIGPKNTAYYLFRFVQFRASGGNFAPTWNWAAFWAPSVWLLYRKMYLFGLIALVVPVATFVDALVPSDAFSLSSLSIGFIDLADGIILGMCGNYLYYTHTVKTLSCLQALMPEDGRLRAARALGGADEAVVWLIVIIYLVAVAYATVVTLPFKG